MGRLAVILEFIRGIRNGAQVSEAKVDAGGGQTIQAEHFTPPGVDASPIPLDYALLVPLPRREGHAVAGYIDPKNTQAAQDGEVRLYARDTEGAEVVQIWLKNTGDILISNSAITVDIKIDGSIRADNTAGNFELQAGGDFVVNNVIITPAGDISTPTKVTAPSVLVDGKELKDHTHSGVTAGGGVTGPNI